MSYRYRQSLGRLSWLSFSSGVGDYSAEFNPLLYKGEHYC